MIHNDHSKGSVNIFTDDQISLIENIAKHTDTSYEITPSSSKSLQMSTALEKTDIYLIPYEKYIEHRQVWCNSAFAQKMRAQHDAAINELEKRELALDKMLVIISQANQAIDKEEIDRIKEELKKEKELIEKTYKPWTSCPHVTSTTIAYETPLGYFNPKTREIFVCLDGIISKYPSKVEAVALLTLFHELGHTIMHNEDHKFYESAFEYWAEEALANKIALQTISVTRNFIPLLFSHALAFVLRQPNEYALGYKLYEHNLLDWYALKVNKSNLNKCGAERWLKIVTSEGITSDNINEVQKAFYATTSVNDTIYLDGYVSPMRDITIRAFKVFISSLESKTTQPKYCANISSTYMGLAYRAITNWKYEVLADCCSSQELNILTNAFASDAAAMEFKLGTYGYALSITNKYRDFLISIGV